MVKAGQERWLAKNGGIAVGLAIFVLWAAVVMASGWGYNPTGIRWDFTETGQLGDSFGVLSSVMAAIAAYYAFRTYRSAREDVERLEQQAAEPSFLNLLERRYDVLDRVRTSEMRISSGRPENVERSGQKAIDRLANSLRRLVERDGALIVSNKYIDIEDAAYGLPNLYRFTYHIITFAQRQFSLLSPSEKMTKDDPAYQYVRLLRAQMSNEELLLLALNCAFGRGKEKFKPLVERYALLHNMSPNDVAAFRLNDVFETEAFGLGPSDRTEVLSEVQNPGTENETKVVEN